MLRAFMDKVETMQEQMYLVKRDGNSQNEPKKKYESSITLEQNDATEETVSELEDLSIESFKTKKQRKKTKKTTHLSQNMQEP